MVFLIILYYFLSNIDFFLYPFAAKPQNKNNHNYVKKAHIENATLHQTQLQFVIWVNKNQIYDLVNREK